MAHPASTAEAPFDVLPANDNEMVLIRRAVLEALVEAAIAALDEADGDPDVEVNGDELDGSSAEEDIPVASRSGQCVLSEPGCPVSDPGGCEHDGLEPAHDRRGTVNQRIHVQPDGPDPARARQQPEHGCNA